MPEHERPRERLQSAGPEALSNAELLAILIKTGTKGETAIDIAGKLLSKHGSLQALAELSVKELSQTDGIGAAKACEIIAALELSRRAGTHRDGLRPRITCPKDVARLVGPEMAPLKKEQFRLALLNAKNELTRMITVSEGTLTGSLTHPREVFREAVREAAAAVLLIHNHPSGDPEPSDDDVKTTRGLVKAGEIIGIQVLDHVIVASGGFRSMKEAGLLE